jgi:hypothetical protein
MNLHYPPPGKSSAATVFIRVIDSVYRLNLLALTMLLFCVLPHRAAAQFCTGDPVPNNQQDLRDNPEYEKGKCPADDIQILGATLEVDNACNSCPSGTVITADLKIIIHHNTNSEDRYLGVFAKLTEKDPFGNTYTCSIARCSGPVLKDQDEVGGQQVLDFGTITYTCGNSLQLSEILLVWTAANGECPVTPDNNPNGKYCFTNSVDIIPPLNAVLTAECGKGNTANINLTVSGGTGPFTYEWSNNETSEDLTNVPLGTYTVTVTDNGTLDENESPCQVIKSITFNGPCCEFFATCNLDPTRKVIEGCDLTDLPDPYTLPGQVFKDVTQNPCGELVLKHKDVSIGSLCPDGLSVKRTYTLFDDLNDNQELDPEEEFEICVENYKIVDKTPPVLYGVPDNTSVSCDAIPEPATVTATDNCGPDPSVSFKETNDKTGDCANYTITRTWSASDACGNPVSASQTIKVYDKTPPVLHGVPDNTSASCDAIPEPATVTATDNCGPDPSVSFKETNDKTGDCANYTITRTWSASDACGNPVSASQTIKVYDKTPPALIALFPTGSTDLDKCFNKIPEGPSEADVKALFKDNCGNVHVAKSGEPTGDDCYWSVTYTYEVKDDCGNAVTPSPTVTYSGGDKTPPIITCPANKEIYCNDLSGLEPAYTGYATATDNCGGTPDITWSDEKVEVCDKDYYIIKRTWKATDACENSSECVQEIKVWTKITNGCYTLTVNVQYDEVNNTTTYTWKLGANGCPNAVSYVAFSMPPGVIAIQPKNKSIYDYPSNKNDYHVENPTNNPFYSIKFGTIGEGLKNGTETFVYTLPGMPMESVQVQVKAGNKKVDFSININRCNCSGSSGSEAIVGRESLALAAKAGISEVALDWATNTEYKNDYFVIERSFDGQSFEPILTQEARRNGDDVEFYQVSDKAPLEGDNYYRVKSSFDDGSFKYSNIQKVHFITPDGIVLYPNPASAEHQLRIYFEKLPESSVQVNIFNQVGTSVKQFYLPEVNDHFVSLDVQELKNGGIYTVYIQAEGRKPIAKKLVFVH